MQYKWILFDADETLVHFDSNKGLKTILNKHNITISQAEYQKFCQITNKLWEDFQNQAITIPEIIEKSFSEIASKIGLNAFEFNDLFQTTMSKLCPVIDEVLPVLEELQKHGMKMAIVSNGFQDQQIPRLKFNKMDQFFEFIVTAEKVGYPKPNSKIFQACLAQMPNIKPSQVLMVGDNLFADVKGANDFGFDSCWFNHRKDKLFDDINPKFIIHKMSELLNIVL